MKNTRDMIQDDFEDEGMEIHPDLINTDYDDVGFDPVEEDDADDDMAEFLDY